MEGNVVKQSVIEGKASLGIRIQAVRSLDAVKIFAEAGMQWAWLDCEHGAFSIERIREFCRYSTAIGLCPVVKVPQLAYHAIAGCLDQEAMGIIVPLVETEEQALQAVQYSRYPPLGKRGCGLDNNYFGWKGNAAEYMEWANDNILLILQIESETAVENIDAIAQVAGVDVLLMGPLDLSVSLGIPGDYSHPRHGEATQRVLDACKRHGKVFGVPGTVDYAVYWAKRGALFLTIAGDTSILAAGCSDAIRSFEDKLTGGTT